jgi:Lrp/AsnC family transcriptional regulator
MTDAPAPDSFDRKILAMLQTDPAITMADLAAAVGLSQTPCWRRIKQLESAGVIARRAVLLDPRRLGYPVNVFAHIRIGKHDEGTLEAFEEQVRSYPEIVECFSMTGESDYVMRILARSIEDYERFLKKRLLHLPGVTSVNSSFALKAVKLTTDIPVEP